MLQGDQFSAGALDREPLIFCRVRANSAQDGLVSAKKRKKVTPPSNQIEPPGLLAPFFHALAPYSQRCGLDSLFDLCQRWPDGDRSTHSNSLHGCTVCQLVPAYPAVGRKPHQFKGASSADDLMSQ